ncbi:MAG: hypothetical protein ACREQ5_31770, partial [Candidatus Dormibacteria bacterium]
MNPSRLLALANASRSRRGDTEPREPFANAKRARQALAEAGVAISHLTNESLEPLARLAGAASELADRLAVQRPPPRPAVHALNELASGSTGKRQLAITQG